MKRLLSILTICLPLLARVTTALEMEIGVADVDKYYRDRQAGEVVNFGATIGHVPSRMQIMKDPGPSLVPKADGAYKAASEEEITAMRRRIETGLAQGGHVIMHMIPDSA